MHAKKTFLALIPARAGSKRLPNKNLLPLANKPLIAWTIEAAVQSEYIDYVLVTSDSSEILKTSAKYGAATLKRPPALAQDDSPTNTVVEHALQNVSHFDFIVLLQPTSPMRTSKHIDGAIRVLVEKNARAVVSVTEMEHSPLWSAPLPDDNNMENFFLGDAFQKRSQDLPAYFRVNGAIYICCTKSFKESCSLFLTKDIFGFRMDRQSSVDVDNLVDFRWAQFLKLDSSRE